MKLFLILLYICIMGNKLIEKIKLKQNRKKKHYLNYTDEEYDLALAYIRGEVSFLDIKFAMNYNNLNAVYPFLVAAFKRYYKENNG